MIQFSRNLAQRIFSPTTLEFLTPHSAAT